VEGQCTVPAAAATGVTAIAAGKFRSLALRKDGSVVAWGCGDRGAFFDGGQCVVSSAGARGVTAISGACHTLVLKAGDTIPRCTVPQVVDKPLASARRTLAASRCRAGKVMFAYSRKAKKSIVIGQSRRPGPVPPQGSAIDLVVSRGRRHR